MAQPIEPDAAARAAAVQAHLEGRGGALNIQGIASLPEELQKQYLKPGEVIQFDGAGKAYIVISSSALPGNWSENL